MNSIKRNYKVLFVSSSGKIFKLIPFIKSQFESLQPHINTLDHYRIQGGGMRSYITAFKELKRKLKNENYDIVHSHWTYAGILCASLIKKEKLVVSFMGNDLQGIYSSKYNLLTAKGLLNIVLSQYLLYKSDGVIVKSKKMLRWIPYHFRHKTQIIPNGVNLKKFKMINRCEAIEVLNLNPDTKYILFLCDVTDLNKNFKLLRKALYHLDRLDIKYELLTPYPVDTSLVPYYLAAATVMAFPSKLEGSPNIVKEALAMGCPIVATDVGDVRERIEGIEGCYITKFQAADFSKQLIAALNFNKRIDSKAQLTIISESYIAEEIMNLYTKSLRI